MRSILSWVCTGLLLLCPGPVSAAVPPPPPDYIPRPPNPNPVPPVYIPALEQKYSLKCTLQMLGCDGNLEVVKESGFVALKNQPGVLMNFGQYSLSAAVFMRGNIAHGEIQPEFSVTLCEGNPIQGEIHNAAITGLDFDKRIGGKPLVLDSHKFLNFSYRGKKYTRVDYVCELTMQK